MRISLYMFIYVCIQIYLFICVYHHTFLLCRTCCGLKGSRPNSGNGSRTKTRCRGLVAAIWQVAISRLKNIMLSSHSFSVKCCCCRCLYFSRPSYKTKFGHLEFSQEIKMWRSKITQQFVMGFIDTNKRTSMWCVSVST